MDARKKKVGVVKKAVVLLSGGIDSATCLYLAKKKGFKPYCLIFDYGQSHLKEITQAKKIAQRIKSPYLVSKISLPWKGSSLIDRRMKIPKRSRGIPSTYVAGRNNIFLSFALSYAEVIKAKAIFIGANARDFSGYPDCRPQFYQAFKSIAKQAVKDKSIRICVPLLDKTKAQIVRLGIKLGVPFNLSWSCYRGKKYPCGECSACRIRAKGFNDAGVNDPLLSNKK